MFIAPPTSLVETPALVEQRQRELLARAERHRLIATARRLPHRQTPPTAEFRMIAVDDEVSESLVIATARHQHPQRRDGLDLPCRRNDSELWFADAPADLERAKALCRACPVRLTCLSHAIEHNEYTGVWGGHIIDRGRIIPNKRPRGRPRKPGHNSGATRHPASTPERDHIPLDRQQCGQGGRSAAAARLSDAERALRLAQHGDSRTPIDAAHLMLERAAMEYLTATSVNRSHRRAPRRTPRS